MSTAGLSLVGFMTDQPQAFQHLRVQCVPADPSDAALAAAWNAAKAKLGAALPNAGAPNIQAIAAADAPYINQLVQQPWVQEAFRLFKYAAADFKLIEIDPLLAFQFIVDSPRSNFHCGGLKNPTVADLLPICLPQTQPKPQDIGPAIDASPNHKDIPPQSVTIKVRNLSMQRMHGGIFTLNQNGYESWVVGMQIHVTLPFVHVVRFNGRCYLHNGFHRSYGARMAGATHIPCLFRDVATPEEVGIIEGQTFSVPILESANPPTIGHFTQGRAYDVELRALSRVMHVSWSQSVMVDEYERMNP